MSTPWIRARPRPLRRKRQNHCQNHLHFHRHNPLGKQPVPPVSLCTGSKPDENRPPHASARARKGDRRRSSAHQSARCQDGSPSVDRRRPGAGAHGAGVASAVVVEAAYGSVASDNLVRVRAAPRQAPPCRPNHGPPLTNARERADTAFSPRFTCIMLGVTGLLCQKRPALRFQHIAGIS